MLSKANENVHKCIDNNLYKLRILIQQKMVLYMAVLK